jgi:hypothetical protein
MIGVREVMIGLDIRGRPQIVVLFIVMMMMMMMMMTKMN